METVSPDRVSVFEDERGTELSFDVAAGHVVDRDVCFTVTLGMGTESGLYNIGAVCLSSEGKTLSSRNGCLNLVSGMPRQLSFPLFGENEGEFLRITLSRQGEECVRSLCLTDMGAGNGLVTSGVSPDVIEIPVGETTVLSRTLFPSGLAEDAEVKVSDYVEVSVDDFGIGVKPCVAGESELVISSGGARNTVILKAVTGTPAASVVLPEKVVILSGGQGAVVAETVPYGVSLEGCSWSVDYGSFISVHTEGPVAYISGLAPGTARLSFSSPVGNAVTEVTVLEAAQLKRVSSVVLPEKVTLKAGKTSSLNVKYEPSDAVVGRVVWSVSNDGVVDLTPSEFNCELRGLRAGTSVVIVDIDGVRTSVDVTVSAAGDESGATVEPTGDVDMAENVVVLVGGEGAVVARIGDDSVTDDCSWSVMPEGCLEIIRTDGSVAFVRGLKNGRVDLVFRAGSSVGVTHVRVIGGEEPVEPEDPEEPDIPGGDVETLESVSLVSEVNLTEGEEKKISAVLSPASYVPESVSWTLFGDDVCTLSKDGSSVTVKATKAGTATLTVNVDGKTASSKIVVKGIPEPIVVLENVSLEVSRTSVLPGESVSLDVVLSPEDYIPESICWTVSPSGIFNIAGDGLEATAKALSPGTVTVTVNIDDKTASVDVTVIKPEPAYTSFINGTEFFEGQSVGLSFYGAAVKGMVTEVTLDGKAFYFSPYGVSTDGLPAGEHMFAVVQKMGDYVVDRTEHRFSVYAAAPEVVVREDGVTGTYSTSVCLPYGKTVGMSVRCAGVDSFTWNFSSSAQSLFSVRGDGYMCVSRGEGYIEWTARKGTAVITGRMPLVVYDVITVKVSAYAGGMSASSCNLTLEVLDNMYGMVSASGVTFTPYYRALVPDGREITYAGKTVNAGTISLSQGDYYEWNIGEDVSVCEGKVSGLGYKFSDISAIYITLDASGTLSERYLVVKGEKGEVKGALTGDCKSLKEFFNQK